MHELSIMINIVKTVEDFARENKITEIETLVIQIGELSSVVPRFAEACYPAAVDGTMLEDTKLEIEILPANCLCNDCKDIYSYIEYKGVCPKCKSRSFELLCGREFNIKEIVAC